MLMAMIPILTKAAALALVDELKSRVQARVQGRLKRAVLFGSYARGTVSEDSDIDVLLLFENLTSQDKDVVAEESAALIIRDQIVLSPISIDQVEYARLLDRELIFALDVEREGIVR
jgi:predicted nucleotidyltransferase